MIYGAEGARALNADIVFNVGPNSYVCKLDPTKVDRSPNALPVKQQPVWSITFYKTTEYEDGNSMLETLYPNGNNAYNFVAEEYANYNYIFRL